MYHNNSDRSIYLLLVAISLASVSVCAAARDSDENDNSPGKDKYDSQLDKYQAEYRKTYEKLYAQSGEPIAPVEVLQLLRRSKVLLKRLPKSRQSDLDLTIKLIKLGELDESLCYEHTFDIISNYQKPAGGPYVNLTPFVQHHSKELKEICDLRRQQTGSGVSGVIDTNDHAHLEAKHDSIYKRLYTKSGDSLKAEETLELFREIWLPLKRLPKNREREMDSEFVLKMIRLGELDERMCNDQKFAWFKNIIEHQASLREPYVNLTPFVQYYSKELREKCRFYLDDNFKDDGGRYTFTLAKHAAVYERIFSQIDEPLEPEETLRLLRKIWRFLKVLPENDERIKDLELTTKLIRLGELDGNLCPEPTSAWFKEIIKRQAASKRPNTNVISFVKHYLEALDKSCNRHLSSVGNSNKSENGDDGGERRKEIQVQ